MESDRLVALISSDHFFTENAWDAVNYLAEFNAGPDGIPPAVLFLELLAGELKGEVGDLITDWVGEQVRRLRLTSALERERSDREPVPDEPHLCLTIMLEPDSIDPGRCVLTCWRQDEPTVWGPVLGDVREARIDELEHQVDEVILEAEGMWSGQGVPAAVEFVLPRTCSWRFVASTRRSGPRCGRSPRCWGWACGNGSDVGAPVRDR